jgi:hypothetical protein
MRARRVNMATAYNGCLAQTERCRDANITKSRKQAIKGLCKRCLCRLYAMCTSARTSIYTHRSIKRFYKRLQVVCVYAVYVRYLHSALG